MKWMDLIREGHIVQGLIAVGCVATIIYLSVTGQDVPGVLVGIAGTIIGFYFKSGAEAIALRRQGR